MKNTLITLSICVLLSSCTRMTIPVNIMPLLLIQENQNRVLDSELIEYNQQIAFNQNFTRLPQQ
ncbi:hypothetical protein K8I31_18520, partial [bacterium]|nr:hypothetical protein [bacterium]